MKKNIIIVLLIVLIGIASVLGILLYNKEHKIIENEKQLKELVKENVSIGEFKKKLEDAEIKIDEESDSASSEIIGASEGKVYKIGDSAIRVYKYDLNQTGELTVSNLKLAQESGKVKIPSLDDLEIDVIYNKGLVLINDEEFENKDKIIEIFKGL